MKLFCVALILVVVGAVPYPTNKPGFCPPSDLVGSVASCVFLCTNDASCPGNQKCCNSVVCGRGCYEPTKVDCTAASCLRPTCSNPVRPPGQCCLVCYGPRY